MLEEPVRTLSSAASVSSISYLSETSVSPAQPATTCNSSQCTDYCIFKICSRFNCCSPKMGKLLGTEILLLFVLLGTAIVPSHQRATQGDALRLWRNNRRYKSHNVQTTNWEFDIVLLHKFRLSFWPCSSECYNV